MTKRSLQNSIKGFSLIEFVIVVAIVSLIAVVVMASVSSSRLKTRDARRIADIQQLRLAFEQFFLAYKVYPDPPYCNLLVNNSKLAAYLNVVPRDPNDITACGANPTYHYEYYANLPLSSTQWLLRVPGFELPKSIQGSFAEDLDGDIVPQGGGAWYDSINCTALSPCSKVDCGIAPEDTTASAKYCIGSQ